MKDSEKMSEKSDKVLGDKNVLPIDVITENSENVYVGNGFVKCLFLYFSAIFSLNFGKN